MNADKYSKKLYSFKIFCHRKPLIVLTIKYYFYSHFRDRISGRNIMNQVVIF